MQREDQARARRRHRSQARQRGSGGALTLTLTLDCASRAMLTQMSDVESPGLWDFVTVA